MSLRHKTVLNSKLSDVPNSIILAGGLTTITEARFCWPHSPYQETWNLRVHSWTQDHLEVEPIMLFLKEEASDPLGSSGFCFVLFLGSYILSVPE